MTSRHMSTLFVTSLLVIGTTTGGRVRAQLGGYGTPGYPSTGQYGAYPSYGYGVNNGRVGSGYQSAGRLYPQSYQVARPQTTIALQPLYSAITSLPGWYGGGTTHRIRRRVRPRPSPPPETLFDDNGKVLWPSTIPDDPADVAARKAADAAVRTVVLESKSTGHASVRPVVERQEQAESIRAAGTAPGQGQERHRRRHPRDVHRQPGECARRDVLRLLERFAIESRALP